VLTHKSAIVITEISKYDIIVRVNHEPLLVRIAKKMYPAMDLRKTVPMGLLLKGLCCKCRNFHGPSLMSKTAPWAILGQLVLQVRYEESRLAYFGWPTTVAEHCSTAMRGYFFLF